MTALPANAAQPYILSDAQRELIFTALQNGRKSMHLPQLFEEPIPNEVLLAAARDYFQSKAAAAADGPAWKPNRHLNRVTFGATAAAPKPPAGVAPAMMPSREGVPVRKFTARGREIVARIKPPPVPRVAKIKPATVPRVPKVKPPKIYKRNPADWTASAERRKAAILQLLDDGCEVKDLAARLQTLGITATTNSVRRQMSAQGLNAQCPNRIANLAQHRAKARAVTATETGPAKRQMTGSIWMRLPGADAALEIIYGDAKRLNNEAMAKQLGSQLGEPFTAGQIAGRVVTRALNKKYPRPRSGTRVAAGKPAPVKATAKPAKPITAPTGRFGIAAAPIRPPADSAKLPGARTSAAAPVETSRAETARELAAMRDSGLIPDLATFQARRAAKLAAFVTALDGRVTRRIDVQLAPVIDFALPAAAAFAQQLTAQDFLLVEDGVALGNDRLADFYWQPAGVLAMVNRRAAPAAKKAKAGPVVPPALTLFAQFAAPGGAPPVHAAHGQVSLLDVVCAALPGVKCVAALQLPVTRVTSGLVDINRILELDVVLLRRFAVAPYVTVDGHKLSFAEGGKTPKCLRPFCDPSKASVHRVDLGPRRRTAG